VCDDAVATITVGAGAADMAPQFASSGSAALPSVIAPGQTYAGLQLTCTNAGPNTALSPTCSVSADIGTITGFSCVPNLPASLAPGGAITCTFNYVAPGTLGGSDLPPRIVQFTGITNASNDSNGANNIVQGVAPSGVAPIVIDAIDDSGTFDTATGGIISILTNDQLGATNNPAVSATGVTAPVVVPGVNTTLPGATIDGGNNVVVAPNTPPGTYTVEYEICAQAAPTVCDRAIVTITVTGAPAEVTPKVVPTLSVHALLALMLLLTAFARRGFTLRGSKRVG
jgi:hypothetical protein